jgi:hypothetical protein
MLIGIAAFALIVSWNSLLFLDWMNPNGLSSANTASAPEAKLWQDIKKTIADETKDRGLVPTFDQSVIASENAAVELRGVGFLLKSGVNQNSQGEKTVSEFMLLPGHGGVAWCCGLTPIAELKYSVLVECKSPFPIEKADPLSSSVFVNVKGRLRLNKVNSIDAFYTIEDAEIEFLDIQDVLPLNVMNQCLNQPMVQ